MILDDLVQSTRIRVEQAKQRKPFFTREELAACPPGASRPTPEVTAATAAVRETAPPSADAATAAAINESPRRPSFETALSAPGLSFICEVKKASPSKGIIAEDFPWMAIARDYEAAGASAISVLTEPAFFLGSNRYLEDIAAQVRLPVLRKDFIIDPWQIEESKAMGASAILLICAILDQIRLESYICRCHDLGMSALVEVHDENEMDAALAAGARIIGVNNRDLRDFSVDLGLSLKLRRRAPKCVLFVAESGIHTPEDIRLLAGEGIDGGLMGETLMRAPDRQAHLLSLKDAAEEPGPAAP